MRWRTGEDGQAAIEVIGTLPLLVLFGLAVLQALLVAHTAVSTEHAARVGARVAMEQGSGSAVAAARAALPDGLAPGALVNVSDATVTVTSRVPDVLPGVDFAPLIDRSVQMPEVATWD